MGVEPVEKDTPSDIGDFPDLIQTCIIIYNCLKDNWDSFGGNYLGKDISIIFDLFRLFEIDYDQQKLCFKIIQHLDSVRSQIIGEKIKAKNQKPSSTNS